MKVFLNFKNLINKMTDSIKDQKKNIDLSDYKLRMQRFRKKHSKGKETQEDRFRTPNRCSRKREQKACKTENY